MKIRATINLQYNAGQTNVNCIDVVEEDNFTKFVMSFMMLILKYQSAYYELARKDKASELNDDDIPF